MRFLLTSAGIKNTSIHDALVDLLDKPIAEILACAGVRECPPTDKGGKLGACRPRVSLSRSAGCEPRKSSPGAAR